MNLMACLCINSENLWFPPSSPRLSPKCVLRNPNSLPLPLNNNTHVIIPFFTSPLQKMMMSCSIPSRRRSSFVTVSSHMATTAEKPISENRMLVFVPPHPLVKHWVSVLRNEQTPSPVFRSAMAELGRLLMYEASRDWLPTVTGEIQSPMGLASVEFVDPRQPMAVIPILRAGLALSEHASSILPATKTYHIGVSRDEETLLPTVYLNKLPDKFPEGSRVFVVDPILATGGTIVAALDLVKERGVENNQIKVARELVLLLSPKSDFLNANIRYLLYLLLQLFKSSVRSSLGSMSTQELSTPLLTTKGGLFLDLEMLAIAALVHKLEKGWLFHVWREAT